jgi:DHA1 family bicyclomycin/chloramphenicol resistance-like MFS transporter
MLISLVLGTAIGQSYNGTVLPLVVGFAALSACAMLVSWWAEGSSRQAVEESATVRARGSV